MKLFRLFIFIFLGIFICQHFSLALGYKYVGSTTINWNMFEIVPPSGWIGKESKKMYKLLYKYSKEEYGAVLIGSPTKLTYKEYKKVLKSTYRDFKKDPTNRNIRFIASSKYTILGKKHTPCITFITKGKRFFVFAPYVDGKMYMLLAISWRKNSMSIPQYTLKMINNVKIKDASVKHKQIPILPIETEHRQNAQIKPKAVIHSLDGFTNTASITTTKSLLRQLYGRLTPSQEKIFNKQFNKYYEYPCDEVKNYFTELNDALVKSVNLKTKLSISMAEYAKYSAEISNAYTLKNPKSAEDSIKLLLQKRKDILNIHKQLNMINTKLSKLLKTPNPEKIKKERQKRLKSLLLDSLNKHKKGKSVSSSIDGVWELEPNDTVTITSLYSYGKDISTKTSKVSDLDETSATGFMIPFSSRKIYIKDVYRVYKNLHMLYLYRFNDKYSFDVVAQKADGGYIIYSDLTQGGFHYKLTVTPENDSLVCVLQQTYNGYKMFIYRYVMHKVSNPKNYPVSQNYSKDELEEDFQDTLKEYEELPENERVVKISKLSDDAGFLQRGVSVFIHNSNEFQKEISKIKNIPENGKIDINKAYWKLKKVSFEKSYPYPYDVSYSISNGWIRIYTTSTVLSNIKTSKNSEYVPNPDEEETPSNKKVLVAALYWNPAKKAFKENEQWHIGLKGKSKIPITWRVYLPQTYSGYYDKNNNFVFKTKKQQRLPSDTITINNALLEKSKGKMELQARITTGCKDKELCPVFRVIYTFSLNYNQKNTVSNDNDMNDFDFSGLSDKEEFYKTQIEWLKNDIAVYKKMLKNAKTKKQKLEINMWIMGKEADLQQQIDLLNEIKTGQFKHTITKWDRYNENLTKQMFIESSIKYQRKTQLMDNIYSLASKLKKHGYNSLGNWAQNQIKRSSDSSAKLEKVYIRLRKQYANLLEQNQENKQLKLLEIEDRLKRAEGVKSWAEFGVMAGSMVSLKASTYIYAGYTGITNSLSDGIAQGAKHAVENLNAATMVAASAYDGYNTIDPKTGKKIGIKGALSEGGLTLATVGMIHFATTKVINRCSLSKNVYKKYAIDAAHYEQERKASIKMVKNFEERIKNIEQQLVGGNTLVVKKNAQIMEDDVKKLMASPQAKNYLKYQAPESVQRIYNHYEQKVRNKIIDDFKKRMKKLGWQDFDVKEFRNAKSLNSVGMDWDLGLIEEHLETKVINGIPKKVIKKGGKYLTIEQFQKEAEKEFQKSYKDITGYSAEGSFANLTTSVHKESFRDLEILNDAAKARPEFAKDTAETVRYKAEIMKSARVGLITKTGKYNEMCRGLGKEIEFKLIPNLKQSKKISKKTLESQIKYFTSLKDILMKFGKNEISIVEAEIRVRNLTGESIPDIAKFVSSNLETAIKSKVK